MKKILLLNPWIYDFAAYDLWSKPLGLMYIAAVLKENDIEFEYLDMTDFHDPSFNSLGFFYEDDPIKPFRGKKQSLKKIRISLKNKQRIQSNKIIKEAQSDFQIPKRYSSGKGKYFSKIIDKPAQYSNIKRRYRRFGIAPNIFANKLKAIEPDIICITSIMTYWYLGTFETIRIIRDILPNAFIILGGNYPILSSSHATNKSNADIVYTEPMLDNFFKILSEKIKKTINYSKLSNYIPYYDYYLINSKKQIDTIKKEHDSLEIANYYLNTYSIPLLTSFGCPNHCPYCAVYKLQKKYIKNDINRIFKTIERIYHEYQISNFAFYDNALLYKKYEHFLVLLDMILRTNIRAGFYLPNGIHIKYLDDNVVSKMREAGFRYISLGFDYMQESIKADFKMLMEKTRILKKYGYTSKEVKIYLIAGYPGQSPNELRNIILRVKETGFKPSPNEFSPIEKTSLWNSSLKISRYDLKDPLFQNNSIFPLENTNFSIQELNKLKLLSRET